MEGVTTMMSTILDDKNNLLSGEETYPVIGDTLDEGTISHVLRLQKGLNRYWNCFEKAHQALLFLGYGELVVGELAVWSSDMRSSYGFEYNPPYEFHAWLNLTTGLNNWREGIIFDCALPGVIEKGLSLCDEQGPAIIGRRPSILAGIPPDWLKYEGQEIVMKL